MQITRKQLRRIISEEISRITEAKRVRMVGIVDSINKANQETFKRIIGGEDLTDEFNSDLESVKNLMISNVDMKLGSMRAGNAAWRWELAFNSKSPPAVLSQWETSDSEYGTALDANGDPVILPGPELYKLLKSGQLIVKL